MKSSTTLLKSVRFQIFEWWQNQQVSKKELCVLFITSIYHFKKFLYPQTVYLNFWGYKENVEGKVWFINEELSETRKSPKRTIFPIEFVMKERKSSKFPLILQIEKSIGKHVLLFVKIFRVLTQPFCSTAVTNWCDAATQTITRIRFAYYINLTWFS